LDVAVSGRGVFSVQSSDGKEVYTRRGDLKISPSGVLENGKGQLILGDGGAITIPPSRHLEINSRGDILIIPADAVGNNLQAVGRLKLSDAEGKSLRIRPDGLYETLDGTSLETSKNIAVTSGALEGSNVSIIGAMTKMIQGSRDYEMFIRMLKQAKDVDSASAGVLTAE
jgi:flagellar basal-body rod protein FlgF